jgi:hypothetical protein
MLQSRPQFVDWGQQIARLTQELPAALNIKRVPYMILFDGSGGYIGEGQQVAVEPTRSRLLRSHAEQERSACLLHRSNLDEAIADLSIV